MFRALHAFAAAGEFEQALDDFVDTMAHVGRVSGHSALAEFEARAPYSGSVADGGDVSALAAGLV